MKKALRWLVSFLERKFPDRVVVTEASYAALVEVQQNNAEAILALKDEVEDLKRQLANVNVAMGFAAPRAAMLER